MNLSETEKPASFIRNIIDEDIKNNKNDGRVHTRFPPEPNGYLHIGHAKHVCLNFGLAKDYDGKCNLRFDDTNPSKEKTEYVESIKDDIRWLGFDWEDRLYFASDYFDQLYEFAVKLIKDDKAYVDDLSADEIRVYRGTLTEPGKNSPYRDRSVEENLDLFERMKAGDFQNGEKALRAKIDMASPNLYLRDPIMYRIMHTEHHRTGNQWCIYPTYDFTHGQSDAIEGITHSICTLEFEDHRPLYEWYLENIGLHPVQQIEYNGLHLTYVLLSKRNLKRMVEEGTVRGWDDPRMPTLGGMRRRGYTPEAIRNLCFNSGETKAPGRIEFAQLEHYLRDHLNQTAPRVMAVLNPLKIVLTNYPDQVEELEAINNPEDESQGTRKLPFSRELYIERDDFMEEPPKKFFRLAPGREVRLKHAYLITCQKAVKDENTGEILELHCTYDPETRGGSAPDGRKVRGTLHWVSVPHALQAKVRLYEHLFLKENPSDVEQGQDFMANFNPDSLRTLETCYVESTLKGAAVGSRYQFLRHGYFCIDLDSSTDCLVFNRTVSLRDTWAKMAKT